MISVGRVGYKRCQSRTLLARSKLKVDRETRETSDVVLYCMYSTWQLAKEELVVMTRIVRQLAPFLVANSVDRRVSYAI